MKKFLKSFAICLFALVVLFLGYLFALNGRYAVIENGSSANYVTLIDKWNQTIIITKQHVVIDEKKEK